MLRYVNCYAFFQYRRKCIFCVPYSGRLQGHYSAILSTILFMGSNPLHRDRFFVDKTRAWEPSVKYAYFTKRFIVHNPHLEDPLWYTYGT